MLLLDWSCLIMQYIMKMTAIQQIDIIWYNKWKCSCLKADIMHFSSSGSVFSQVQDISSVQDKTNWRLQNADDLKPVWDTTSRLQTNFLSLLVRNTSSPRFLGMNLNETGWNSGMTGWWVDDNVDLGRPLHFLSSGVNVGPPQCQMGLNNPKFGRSNKIHCFTIWIHLDYFGPSMCKISKWWGVVKMTEV